ncbi:MAG: MerC domain-containing protein [Myxococcaceae bacterium]
MKWLDRTGVTVSFACAAHCAAVPLAMAALPLTGPSFLGESTVEIVLIGTSLLVAAFAFPLGWRYHRRLQPLLLLGAGIALISVGQLSESAAEVVVPLGAVVIGVAHLAQLRSPRQRFEGPAEKSA